MNAKSIRSLHTAATCLARRAISPSKGLNRWGSYNRLAPASLANVNVRKWLHRPVPDHVMRPPYAEDGSSSKWTAEIPIQSGKDIIGMREAGKLAKEVLALGSTLCQVCKAEEKIGCQANNLLFQPGVTTNHIDQVLHEAIVAKGAYPSPLNYMGFPKSVCTSINNIIAHGIPDDRPLQDGDIINVDVTVKIRKRMLSLMAAKTSDCRCI